MTAWTIPKSALVFDVLFCQASPMSTAEIASELGMERREVAIILRKMHAAGQIQKLTDGDWAVTLADRGLRLSHELGFRRDEVSPVWQQLGVCRTSIWSKDPWPRRTTQERFVAEPAKPYDTWPGNGG